MKWSWTLCRLFGIRIRVHATFLLLVLVGMEWGYREGRLPGAVWGLLFVLSAFACVVIHELGHSVVAQKLGVRVTAITLLPIGGVASLGSIPEKPSHEIAITVAGPAMNVLIYCVLYLVGDWAPILVPYAPGQLDLLQLPLGLGELIGALLVTNTWMVLFNLIPAYPMDGGRLLRATLASVLPYPRATAMAALVGRVIAVGFVAVAIYRPEQLVLGVIGVLIYFAAGNEAQSIQIRSVLRGAAAGDLMSPFFSRLEGGESAAECLRRIYQTGQDDFPVVAGGRVVGMVTRDAVVEAVQRDGDQVCAADFMQGGFTCLGADTPAEQAHEQMLASGQRSFPVIREGELVGWLTRENILRYVQVRSELMKRGGRK